MIIEIKLYGVYVCVCGLCFSPAPTLRAYAITLLFMYLATKLFQLSYIRSFPSFPLSLYFMYEPVFFYISDPGFASDFTWPKQMCFENSGTHCSC